MDEGAERERNEIGIGENEQYFNAILGEKKHDFRIGKEEMGRKRRRRRKTKKKFAMIYYFCLDCTAMTEMALGGREREREREAHFEKRKTGIFAAVPYLFQCSLFQVPKPPPSSSGGGKGNSLGGWRKRKRRGEKGKTWTHESK